MIVQITVRINVLLFDMKITAITKVKQNGEAVINVIQ